MRHVLFAVMLFVWGPAQAALVYLSDIEALDTNTGRTWLAPSITVGLGPVNSYTENGWTFGTISDALDMINGNISTETMSLEELEYFFGTFWGWRPAEPGQGDKRVTYLTHGGQWPPVLVSDEGITYCCLFAAIEAYLFQYPSGTWDWTIMGGPLGMPASGIWPDARVWLYREAVIPVPGAVWLFGSALAGLGWMRRRSSQRQKQRAAAMLRTTTIALILCHSATTAQAALLGRAPLTPGGTDYQAYYDDVLNITWLADANLALTQDFGVPRALGTGIAPEGGMKWATAQIWITGMNSSSYLGASAWRLPVARPINGIAFNTSLGFDGSTDFGYNISAPGTPFAGSTANELAHLFYVTLGNDASFDTSGAPTGCGTAPPSYCLSSPGPFANLIGNHDHWTGTAFPDAVDRYWAFYTDFGVQTQLSSQGLLVTAWAVHDGDPFAVIPLPPAVWLFASALGVLGWLRRKGSRQNPNARGTA